MKTMIRKLLAPLGAALAVAAFVSMGGGCSGETAESAKKEELTAKAQQTSRRPTTRPIAPREENAPLDDGAAESSTEVHDEAKPAETEENPAAVEAPDGTESAEARDEDDTKAEHDHTAPHGGALYAIGDHFAHVEVVVDYSEALVTLYFLDGEAENPIRLTQESVMWDFIVPAGEGKASDFELRAVANPLTGETVGNSSQFEAEFELEPQAFKAVLKSIDLKGQTFTNVPVEYLKLPED